MEYITGECEYTSLLLDDVNDVLYCGTSRGSVRVHLWPPHLTEESLKRFKLTQQILYLESYEFYGHLFPIDHLHLTPNHNNLISVSSDGMVFILEVKSRKVVSDANVNMKLIIDEDRGVADTLNDLFYVKSTSLKNQQRVLKTMQLEVARYQKKLKTDEENRHKENKLKISRIEKAFK